MKRIFSRKRRESKVLAFVWRTQDLNRSSNFTNKRLHNLPNEKSEIMGIYQSIGSGGLAGMLGSLW